MLDAPTPFRYFCRFRVIWGRLIIFMQRLCYFATLERVMTAKVRPNVISIKIARCPINWMRTHFFQLACFLENVQKFERLFLRAGFYCTLLLMQSVINQNQFCRRSNITEKGRLHSLSVYNLHRHLI